MIKEIILFLNKPHAIMESEPGFKVLISKNVKLFLIHIVLSLIVIIPVVLVKAYFEIHPRDSFQESNSIAFVGIFKYFLLPLIEETAFRLSLFYNKKYLPLSFSAIVLSFLLIFLGSSNYLGMAVIFIAMSFLIYFFLKFNGKLDLILKNTWEKHFKFILYFSVLAFGFMHVLNYQLSLKILLLAPIIVLPQILSGIVYGYARVKYGFCFCFVQHLFYNLILMAPIIILDLKS